MVQLFLSHSQMLCMTCVCLFVCACVCKCLYVKNAYTKTGMLSLTRLWCIFMDILLRKRTHLMSIFSESINGSCSLHMSPFSSSPVHRQTGLEAKSPTSAISQHFPAATPRFCNSERLLVSDSSGHDCSRRKITVARVFSWIFVFSGKLRACSSETSWRL